MNESHQSYRRMIESVRKDAGRIFDAIVEGVRHQQNGGPPLTAGTTVLNPSRGMRLNPWQRGPR